MSSMGKSIFMGIVYFKGFSMSIEFKWMNDSLKLIQLILLLCIYLFGNIFPPNEFCKIKIWMIAFHFD